MLIKIKDHYLNPNEVIAVYYYQMDDIYNIVVGMKPMSVTVDTVPSIAEARKSVADVAQLISDSTQSFGVSDEIA